MGLAMQYRDIGKSGLKASVVGLGTFAIGGWFWGGTDEQKSIAAIQASIDRGVNLIDTAPIYGFGRAEQIVGKAIKGRRDRVIIATKVGLVWDSEEGEFSFYADDLWPTGEPSKYKVYRNLKPASIQKEIERSLKRLDVEYIDLYQTHWQDSTTPIEVTMETLEKLKDQGKIRAIGVSNVTVDHLKRYGDGIVSVQEKFSLIDRSIVAKGIVDYCINHDIAILSYFTLEQGLLTGTMSPTRQFQ
ncbi:MAG: aldo/keto reductase, partial [bacterium]